MPRNPSRFPEVQFDKAKLKALVHYVAWRCQPHELGAVKLHKVLYYTDMLHHIYAGNPFTGATYRKRPRGPMCDQLLGVVRDLAKDGALEVTAVPYFGYRKTEYRALPE